MPSIMKRILNIQMETIFIFFSTLGAPAKRCAPQAIMPPQFNLKSVLVGSKHQRRARSASTRGGSETVAPDPTVSTDQMLTTR